MTKRTGKQLWKAGQSGNPAGRKPGIERVRQLLDPHREKLVQKALDMALAGDTIALKLCLERLAPLPRSEYERVEVPGLGEAQSMADKARCIVDAAGAGQISADAASMLLGAIASAAKILETDELAERIAALEARDLL